ncbi:N-acyl amino acid synthase FeeM domain-containing protein [Azoarcus olearius]|uniref:N-acyl amino acid synthase FeeM catalytic core domain-containing protein n=1 Tax=Azoarcus sp. (strain BH72) TaxID=418699 RepID=A1KAP4_AZOSB|nr:hypothetical protein [Azoarcus olearius]ANQ86444.1 hypothetical protein dqs_3423 [Azoarcus olearius]CAL95900.1 conserved hypothetical protein [Azoarcus olearius]
MTFNAAHDRASLPRAQHRDTSSRVARHATPARLNSNFALIREGYHIRIGDGVESLKLGIRQLIDRMYSSRGLRTYHPEIEQSDSRTTLVACKGDHLFATLTLGLDSDRGLMADTLYGREIDSFRRAGSRSCEVTRLAMDPEHSSPEVMASMFQIVYVLARMVYRMTDLFIEVHPRHAGFYRRMLGYEVVGPERICPRVGAPAVLMHMSQQDVDELVDQFAGQRDDGIRSLYRLFAPPSELTLLQNQLVLG